MPITSSQIIQDQTTPGGTRVIVEEHTWHDGSTTKFRYIAEAETDALIIMGARVPRMEALAKAAELEALEDLLHNPSSVTADVMSGLNHNTPREALKAFLIAFNNSDNPRRLFDMSRYLLDTVDEADITTEVGASAKDSLKLRAQIMLDSEATYNAAYGSRVDIDG